MLFFVFSYFSLTKLCLKAFLPSFFNSGSNPADLKITCDINGTRKQDSRTSDLIFDIPHLVEYLSGICSLEPGDLIFTGTPSGVGVASGEFLKPGDIITTEIEGIGTMTNRCVER